MKKKNLVDIPEEERVGFVDSTYASRYMSQPVPKLKIPDQVLESLKKAVAWLDKNHAEKTTTLTFS
jgi:hypothetical protein